MDGTISYDMTLATVGVDDPKRAWRVDRTDNTTGSWSTVRSRLTRKEAEALIERLENDEE